jgi:hypothetical protein
MSNRERKERKRQRNALPSYTPNPPPGETSKGVLVYRKLTQEDVDKGSMEMNYVDEAGKPCPAFLLTDPESGRLADLFSISEELKAVMGIFEQVEHLLTEFERSTDANEQLTLTGIVRALTDAGIIAYGRCFARGRSAFGHGTRHAIPQEIIDALPAELREVHELAVNLRHQNVAHRLDDNAQSRVVAILQPIETPGVRAAQTEVFHLAPGIDRARQFHGLAKHLREALEPYIISMRQDIQVELSALPHKTLYAMAGVDLPD